MLRYYVSRHYIKWKGKLYKKGELLPENFNDHDRVRSIYPSRIARKEIPDEEAPQGQPPQQPLSGQPTTPANEAPTEPTDPETPETPSETGESTEPEVPEKGAEEAKPKFTFTPTGTH